MNILSKWSFARLSRLVGGIADRAGLTASIESHCQRFACVAANDAISFRSPASAGSSIPVCRLRRDCILAECQLACSCGSNMYVLDEAEFAAEVKKLEGNGK